MRAARDPDEALGEFTSEDVVCVAIPDATRPLDVRPALAALARRLPNMKVVIGLGLHRPMTDRELAPLAPWSPVEHDADDAVPTGEVDGIPGSVGRPVAEADWSLSVGIAELHQYAGVSGGHKGVAVGCGGRETIAALHHRDRVTAPGVRLGQVEANPFRATVDALGEAARCRMSLVWVPRTGEWLAGEPTEVVREAARRLDPWQAVPRRYATVVLRVPRAKAVSFYQASRAATYLALSPAPPVEDGGTLVLDAACPEGLGAEAGFVAALEGCRPPWTELLTGPPPTGAGAQRAVMLALLAQRYRLRVVGCATPAALQRVGIPATDEPWRPEGDWIEVREPFVRLPQVRNR